MIRRRDDALVAAIRRGWRRAGNRRLIEVDSNINDVAFAAEAIRQFGG